MTDRECQTRIRRLEVILEGFRKDANRFYRQRQLAGYVTELSHAARNVEAAVKPADLRQEGTHIVKGDVARADVAREFAVGRFRSGTHDFSFYLLWAATFN